MSATLSKASAFLQNNQPDSAIYYAVDVLRQSEQSNNQSTGAVSLYILGKSYFQKKNIPLALRYLLQSLKLQEGEGDAFKLSRLHFELAEVYEYWAVYSKAIQHYDHVLEDHAAASIDIQKQALLGMARNQQLNNQLDNAIKYYKQLQAIYGQEKNDGAVTKIRGEVIKIYKQQGAYDLALAQNVKVLSYTEAMSDTSEIIVALNNIGVLHRQLNNLDQALNYFERSADLQTRVQAYAKTHNPDQYWDSLSKPTELSKITQLPFSSGK